MPLVVTNEPVVSIVPFSVKLLHVKECCCNGSEAVILPITVTCGSCLIGRVHIVIM